MSSGDQEGSQETRRSRDQEGSQETRRSRDQERSGNHENGKRMYKPPDLLVSLTPVKRRRPPDLL
jgi:hypothetical protein